MVLETAQRLIRRGHTVHVVCIRADAAIVGAVKGQIQFHQIGGPLSSSIWFWLRYDRSCRRVLKSVERILATLKDEPTVLFPQVFPANWWGAHVARRRPELASVWYCQEPSAFIHSSDWKRSLPWPKNWMAGLLSPILAILDRHFCKRFRRVLVNSEFSGGCVQRVYGFSDQECRVVYLGVDHERFRKDRPPVRAEMTLDGDPSCRKGLPPSADQFEVEGKNPADSEQLHAHGSQQAAKSCSAGRTCIDGAVLRVTTIAKLTRFKNVDTIIRAIAELVKRGLQDVQLQIVGTGDSIPFLHTVAAQCGVEYNVVFRGRLTDNEIVDALKQSRVFCLASVDEPFGLVVVESLACGTPVVAVNSGGPKEILQGLSCGRLFEPQNVQALADALEHFLTGDLASLEEFSTAAVERAAHFNWDTTVDALEHEFQAALAVAAPSIAGRLVRG